MDLCCNAITLIDKLEGFECIHTTYIQSIHQTREYRDDGPRLMYIGGAEQFAREPKEFVLEKSLAEVVNGNPP
jgi:hypothetical protein